MDWFEGIVNFVRAWPDFVWAIVVGGLVTGIVASFKDSVEMKIKHGKRDNFVATAGLATVALAGLLALTGPITLWILGGAGLGIFIGALPTEPTQTQQTRPTT